MAEKKARIRDSIVSRLGEYQPKVKSWIEKLPESVRSEMLDIRVAWQAGEINSTARGLARAIVADCRERGMNSPSPEWVREWLTRR